MRIIYVVLLVISTAKCALPHQSTAPDARLGHAQPVPEYVPPSGPSDTGDAADATDAADADADSGFLVIILPDDAGGSTDAAVPDVAVDASAPPDEPDAGSLCTPTTCNPAGGWTCFELMEGGVACGGIGAHAMPCMDRLDTQCPTWMLCQEDTDGGWQCMVDPARTWPQ
jgi:hypothetical protein